MANFFQITPNEIISAVCKSIYKVFGDDLYIYKEKETHLKLPAVTVYCIDYNKINERSDRFTNIFNIIINYFPVDSIIINNKRTEMFSTTEKIMDAIRYINLPAFQKVGDEYVETTLPSKGQDFSVDEKEGFMQISVTYTVRTKYISAQQVAKMDKLQVIINDNC